jgi:hypothetical protein
VVQLLGLLWCGEDGDRGHGSGGDGMPRWIGWDRERDGRRRGASGGMQAWELCALGIGAGAPSDERCLSSEIGVGRRELRVLVASAGAASGQTPRPDIQELVALIDERFA